MLKSKLKPVYVHFSNRWYNSNYGINFSEEIMGDPIKRNEINREMERLLYDRFSDVGLGSREPSIIPTLHTYGDRLTSALFGCEIKYIKDQAPSAIALNATMEDMRNLEVPDFEKSPVIKRVMSDARILKERYGRCDGNVTAGASPLNVAVSVFGEQFLTVCALEPETAQHVLKIIGITLLKLYNEVSAVIDPENYTGENVKIGYGNCPAVMFSPKMYTEVILPVDKWFRSQVKWFGLHHCGVFDKYSEIYKELNPSVIDIGGGSDYSAIRKVFPDLQFVLGINTADAEDKTTSGIDELVGSMVERAGPVEKIDLLWICDLNDTVSDNVVKALRTANERI